MPMPGGFAETFLRTALEWWKRPSVQPVEVTHEHCFPEPRSHESTQLLESLVSASQGPKKASKLPLSPRYSLKDKGSVRNAPQFPGLFVSLSF